MFRTGVATVPLDYGRCPRWLFERMKKLGRSIVLVLVEEFGPEEFLKRISNPLWFQSLGCVLGFDWNSSGLTVTTLGALKAGVYDIQDELGLYICGGKRESRKTPEEIILYGSSNQLSFTDQLVYASKITAKVDSSLVQDGYQIYHHNFIFTSSGSWSVVQQGMNIFNQTARRYHWFSGIEKFDFIDEPHSGIISDRKEKSVLNLTSKLSEENRSVILEQVLKEPKLFVDNLNKILNTTNQFTLMKLPDREFRWHPVVKEKFDLNRVKKIIDYAHFLQPRSFEDLLASKGVGPKTIRALSLVAEIIYGAKASYEDPARYSFAVGGKDGTPFFVQRDVYDRLIDTLEKGIKMAKISLKEKELAQRRLWRQKDLQKEDNFKYEKDGKE